MPEQRDVTARGLRNGDRFLTLCHHRNVTDRVKYAIDDPPSVWVCLDCGDEFPLMGDTDQWKPKAVSGNGIPEGVDPHGWAVDQ